MNDSDKIRILISEFEKAIDSAHYYDQIGWLITSFFLIFVGALIGGILSIGGNNNIKPLIIGITICAMLFGILVERLFLYTQNVKLDEYKLCKRINKEKGLEMIRYKGSKYDNIQNNEINLFIYRIIMLLIEIVLSWIILIQIIN